MASGLLLLACQPDIRPSDSNQVKGAADGASWNTENFFETATVEEVTDFLEGGADLEARTGISGATPLHRAVGFNDLAVIAALLEAGANLELRTDQGLTPLHVAVGFNKNPAIIVALLEAGANLEARSDGGWTPLHVAAGLKAPTAVAALLEAGANLELRTDQGLTPLHVAVGFNKNPAIIAALLDAGANLEARSDDGWTPLHVAASVNDNPAVIAALLDAGADPNARTEEGETARQLANGNEALSNTDVYWRLAHAAAPPWHTITITHTFTVMDAAVSPFTPPIRNLPEAYEGTRGRVVVEGCGRVYLEFTKTPNLVGGSTRDGYDTHQLRGKWDEVPVVGFMVDQTWGENVLHFSVDGAKIKRLESHRELSVGLNWYGAQGNAVWWEFSLKGARDAIDKAKDTCPWPILVRPP